MKRFRCQGFDVLIGILPVLLLAACGGGSGGSPAQPPTATAGSAQTVTKRVTVTLDGSGSSDPGGHSLMFARDTGEPLSGEFFIWRLEGREPWPRACP